MTIRKHPSPSEMQNNAVLPSQFGRQSVLLLFVFHHKSVKVAAISPMWGTFCLFARSRISLMLVHKKCGLFAKATGRGWGIQGQPIADSREHPPDFMLYPTFCNWCPKTGDPDLDSTRVQRQTLECSRIKGHQANQMTPTWRRQGCHGNWEAWGMRAVSHPLSCWVLFAYWFLF